jgi:transcriptional regulator with XRE-family HTH domain
MENNNEVGNRFRSIRVKAKMSQKEFALTIGVSQSLIGEIERGSQEPSRSVLVSIVQKYHVSLDWLVLGIETANELGELERLRVENESLKKENIKMEEEIRKLEIENKEVNRELVERLRQLVEVHNRHLGIT